jgi:internalin A
MKMKKRIVSMFLVAVMAVTALPTVTASGNVDYDNLWEWMNSLVFFRSADSYPALTSGCIAEMIAGGEIPHDVAYLDLEGNDITDLSPFSELTSLVYLNLHNNNVADLSPLAGLIELRLLELGGNNISDLSPLAGLSGLRRITLNGNSITDISPLEGLSELELVSLYDNNIADISPLAGLKKLIHLDLSPHPALDMDLYLAIAEMIILTNNGSISPDVVSQCVLNEIARKRHGIFEPCRPRNLPCECCVMCYNCPECLHLCRDCDVTPCMGRCIDYVVFSRFVGVITNEMLAEMIADGTIPKNVTELHLPCVGITDITPLTQLKDLRHLNLSGYRHSFSTNQITDLTPLAELTGLVTLSLAENGISDISPLAGLTNLEMLILTKNRITDITPLAGLTNLKVLQLWGNEIVEVAPLTGLTNLTELLLCYNYTACLRQLGALKNALSGGTYINAREITADCGKCTACRLATPPMPAFTPAIAEGSPTIRDALEILKYLAKLPNGINKDGDSPSIDDALEVLKFLTKLPSVFDPLPVR